PRLAQTGPSMLRAAHPTLGEFRLLAEPAPGGRPCELLFTENTTNTARLFGVPNPVPWVKDAFHEYLVQGRRDAVNADREGTKAAIHAVLDLPPHGETTMRLRLFDEEEAPAEPLGAEFERLCARRRDEADAFWDARLPARL